MVGARRSKKRKSLGLIGPVRAVCESGKMRALLWLFYIYYTVFPAILVDTTSNINSVWLPSSESAIGNLTKLKRAITNNTAGGSWKQLAGGSRTDVQAQDQVRTGNLHTSSSSLQPAIVSLDGSATSLPALDKKQGERRADGLGFWASGGPAVKLTNAQVEFDDQQQQQQQQQNAPRSRDANFGQGQLVLPLNESKSLSKGFDGSAEMGQFPALMVAAEELADEGNRTGAGGWLTSTAGQLQHAAHLRLPGASLTGVARPNKSQSSLSPASYLYQLPDGDKANWDEISGAGQVSASGDALVLDEHRKLVDNAKQQAQSFKPILSYPIHLGSGQRSSQSSPSGVASMQLALTPKQPYSAYLHNMGLQSAAASALIPLAHANQQFDNRQRFDWDPGTGLFPAQENRKQLVGELALIDNQHRSWPFGRAAQPVAKAAKQKRPSLLSGAFGSRFNQASDEAESNNVSYSKALESAFYGRSRRPPAAHQVVWSASPTGYQLDGPRLVGRPPGYSVAPPVFYATATSPPTLGRPWPESSRPAVGGQSRLRARRPPTSPLVSETRHRASQMTGADKLAQPASFIPVVAVSVTQTSPAPKPTGAFDNESAAELSATTNELDEYLALKTGYKPAKHGQEEFGNLASSSSLAGSSERVRPISLSVGSTQARFRKQEQAKQAKLAKDEHTTTVKSAVFGYLPQQANEPILQALQALNQDALPALPLMSGGADDTDQTSGRILRGPTRLVDYYSPAASVLEHSHASREPAPLSSWQEEAPSLTLRLQANNFLHNDIAHPFGDFHYKQHYAGASLPPSSAAHSFASGLDEGRYKSGLHFGQLSVPVESSPLLAAAATAAAPSHLYAPGQVEPNPLLSPLLFSASPTAHYGQVQMAPAHQQAKRATPAPAKQASQDEQDEQDSDESDSQHQLSSKGKKRSSEFLASAGQLLLSALPLLLAPTLGLMFAAPSPAARYHALLDSSRPAVAVGGSGGALHTSLPSGYINGVVSNASPSPLLFTPAPASPTATPSSSESSTSGASQRRNQSPAAPKSGSFSVTPGPSRMTFLVTTLEPSDEHGSATNATNSTGSAASQPAPVAGSAESTILSNQTIVLVSTDATRASDAWLAGLSASADNATARRASINHYDIGYEGADFDAQFPTLRRPTPKNSSRLDTSDLQADRNTLYPVTSWPSSRRKTVSLITSSGNKTHVDASEKYGPNLNKQPSEKLLKGSIGGRQRPSSVLRLVDDFTLRRFRRQSGGQPESEPERAPRLVRRIRARKADPSLNSTVTDRTSVGNESGLLTHDSYLQKPDQLAGDSTRAKSAHIITTMITQLDPDADNDIQDAGDLREQVLRKKLELDRLNALYSRNQSWLEQSPPMAASEQTDDELGPVSAYSGARGRIKPVRASPVEVISAKVRLFPNGTDLYSTSDLIQSPAPAKRVHRLRQRNESDLISGPRSNLVLAEDTKRALAEFGSLFIQDTLEMSREQQADLEQSVANSQSEVQSTRNRQSDKLRKKGGHSWSLGQPEESAGSAATERTIVAASFSRSTTRAPQEHGWQPRYQPHPPPPIPPFLDRANLFEAEPASYGANDDRATMFGQRDQDYRNGHGYQSATSAGEPTMFGTHYHYTTGQMNRTGSHAPAALQGLQQQPGGFAISGEQAQWGPNREPWPNYAQPSATADQYAYPHQLHYYGPRRPASYLPQGGTNLSAPVDYPTSAGFNPSMPAYHQSRPPPPGDYGSANAHEHHMHFHHQANNHINHQHHQYGPDNHRASPAFTLGAFSGTTGFPRAPSPSVDYSSAPAEIYQRRKPPFASGTNHPSYPSVISGNMYPHPTSGLAPLSVAPSAEPQYLAPGNRLQPADPSYEQNSVSASSDRSDSQAVSDYLKRVQFSDSDRDRLMAR